MEGKQQNRYPDKPKTKKSLMDILYLGNVSKKEILLFTNNLYILLKAGSTLLEAIDVLRSEAKGKLKTILDFIYDEVNRGSRLSDAMNRYPKVFSQIYISMIEIGEESGKLEENLKHLTRQLEESYALRKKIVGAMIYPSVVIISGLGLSIGIAVFVLPKITTLFKNFKVELPLSTRMLIWLSDFIQNNGLLAAGVFIGSIILIIWLTRLKMIKPITHWLILHLPIVKSISKHMNLSMFCRTLGTLLKSGVTIDDGILICTKTIANIHYKNFLNKAWEKIKSGDNLTNILKTNRRLFPPTDVQIISVGEESGSLTESLKYCASIHDKEVDEITKNLASLLEPILLISIGCMVGFLALAIINPIYAITGHFRG